MGPLIAAFLVIQAVPETPSAQQAQGQAALTAMAEIFTVMGSCERHFSPQQVAGVRQAFQPEPGERATPLQAYIAAAYEQGKADTSKSEAFCQEAMRILAEAKNEMS